MASVQWKKNEPTGSSVQQKAYNSRLQKLERIESYLDSSSGGEDDDAEESNIFLIQSVEKWIKPFTMDAVQKLKEEGR